MTRFQPDLLEFLELFVASRSVSEHKPDAEMTPQRPTMPGGTNEAIDHPRNIPDVIQAIEQAERCLELLEKCLDS